MAQSTVPTGNTYDKYGSSNPIERRLMQGFFASLETCLPATAPARVLEIGVGEAEVARRLATRWPAATIIGLDLPDPALASAWAASPIHGLFGDVAHLPFPDERFDLVLGIEVLERVEDPAAALTELARVATPTASVVVSVPREPVWRAANLARGKYVRDLGNTPGHIQHWGKQAFADLVGRPLRGHVGAVALPVDDGGGPRRPPIDLTLAGSTAVDEAASAPPDASWQISARYAGPDLPGSDLRRHWPRLVVAIGFGALVVGHLLLQGPASGPFVYDEAGFLGNARLLSGNDNTWIMHAGPYYRFGYSLLLAPLFRFFSDPGEVYEAMNVLNAVLLSSVFPLVYMYLRRVHDAGVVPALVGAAVGSIHPAVAAYGGIAFSENLLFPLFIAVLLAAWAFLTASGWRTRLIGPAAVSIVAVHSRFTATIPLTLALLALIAYARPERRRAAAVNAGAIVVGLLVIRVVDQWLIDARWVDLTRPHDQDGGVLGLLTDPRRWDVLFARGAGQSWYLLLTSAGVDHRGGGGAGDRRPRHPPRAGPRAGGVGPGAGRHPDAGRRPVPAAGGGGRGGHLGRVLHRRDAAVGPPHLRPLQRDAAAGAARAGGGDPAALALAPGAPRHRGQRRPDRPALAGRDPPPVDAAASGTGAAGPPDDHRPGAVRQRAGAGADRDRHPRLRDRLRRPRRDHVG